MKSKVPNPGSEEAVKRGCTCPVLDNAFGKGYMGQPGVFVQVADCPIHGLKSENQDETKS
ncbi:MAG: hypothetical protein D6698_02475 [Gammaproteobacteria bacterium]|nr:MAG: hypothetical protein D6698_02475 [Gammaproteobacteria bacterium]